MQTQILVTIDHKKPLPDQAPVLDILAQRLYGYLSAHDCLSDVEARLWSEVKEGEPSC